MSSSSNRVRRGRRANSQSAKTQIGRLKSELHGHPNKLRHLAPPDYSRKPFNNLVVSHVITEAGAEQFISPASVVNFIKTQLGLQAQTATNIVFKLRRIDYYAVATGPTADRPAVFMQVSSLVPTLGDPATPGNAVVSYGNLYDHSDLGSVQDCAKLSYTLPKAMQDIPLGQQSAFNFLSCSANVPNSELRFHIQWSTIAYATPTD